MQVQSYSVFKEMGTHKYREVIGRLIAKCPRDGVLLVTDTKTSTNTGKHWLVCKRCGFNMTREKYYALQDM